MPWDDKTKGSGPWGGGGSGNNGGEGGSPWNRPGKPDSGKEKDKPADLEEQMRRMQERFRQRRNGGGGGRKGGGGGRGGAGGGGLGRGAGPLGILVIVGVGLLAWLSTSIVVVDPTQQAAVFRFGKWQANYGPGLHFHLPAPLESHRLIQVETRNETRIGNTQDESLMLTQDENIVDIHFSIIWKVDTQNPENYVLNVRDPDTTVAMVGESVMREVVGKTRLQDIITTERDQVQQQVAGVALRLVAEGEAEAAAEQGQTGVVLVVIQLAEAGVAVADQAQLVAQCAPERALHAGIDIQLWRAAVLEPHAGRPAAEVPAAVMSGIEAAVEGATGAGLHQPLGHAACGGGGQTQVVIGQFTLHDIGLSGLAAEQRETAQKKSVDTHRVLPMVESPNGRRRLSSRLSAEPLESRVAV